MRNNNNYVKVTGRVKGTTVSRGKVSRVWFENFDDTSTVEALTALHKAELVARSYRTAGLLASLSLYRACRALPAVSLMGEISGAEEAGS